MKKFNLLSAFLFFVISLSAQLGNYEISGQIYDEFNIPLSNIRIKLFDKDLKEEVLVGQTNTGTNGYYKFTLKKTVALPEYLSPDIFLIAFDGNNQIGKSPIWFNIKDTMIIDFKIDNTEIKPLNEFDALLNTISPIIHSTKLSDTYSNDEIDFVARETDQDKNNIRKLLDAHKLHKISDGHMLFQQYRNIPKRLIPDYYYGLLREGFPNDIEIILKKSREEIRSAIKRAVDKNIISGKILFSI